MSAFLKWFRPFFPDAWGWPEAIVLALAGLCVLVLVASAAVVALRIFRPLQQSSNSALEGNTRFDPQQTNLALIHLLSFSIDQATVFLIDQMLGDAPNEIVMRDVQDLKMRLEVRERIGRFVGKTKATFSPWDISGDLGCAMVNAERAADAALAAYLKDKPGEIDRLTILRDDFVAEAERDAAIAYLKAEKSRRLEQMVTARSGLISSYTLRLQA